MSQIGNHSDVASTTGRLRMLVPGKNHSAEDRQRLRDHHRHYVWMPVAVVMLGFWLLLAPVSLGYANQDLWVVPSGGRGAWYADSTLDSLRASLMTWSDVASGLLLIVFGGRSLRPNRPVARWVTCSVGVWLLFAPVFLWAPTAGGFVNASLVGVAVVALSVAIGGTPNEPAFAARGPHTPPGWSYNPSSWPQRGILIAFALIGLGVSRYMAAYQLGYIDSVWDPLFGSAAGTHAVLDSDVSHAFPVSDAGLGAGAYTLELLVAFIGGTARWRTSPYMVLVFGILVIPLGLTHTLLFIAMPLSVQAWCLFCFVAGIVILPMVVLAVDEVAAMLQHLRQARARGDRSGSLWKVFWLGGSADGCTEDQRTPDVVDLPAKPWAVSASSIWGVSLPPGLIVAFGLGWWLYVTPSVFGVQLGSAEASIAHVFGTFIIVVSAIAVAEVLRPLRLLVTLAGVTGAASVWILGAGIGYSSTIFATCAVIAIVSMPRGRIRERYGMWDSLARWPR